jgi:hypothetical protein
MKILKIIGILALMLTFILGAYFTIYYKDKRKKPVVTEEKVMTAPVSDKDTMPAPQSNFNRKNPCKDIRRLFQKNKNGSKSSIRDIRKFVKEYRLPDHLSNPREVCMYLEKVHKCKCHY